MIRKIILCLAFFLCLFSLKSMATVVYVDSANTNAFQDGSSWAYAFTNPQNGINAANPGDTIWIAKGTYQPSSGSYYTMKNGVKVFGGFLNSDTQFTQRNWQLNVTILKGNNNSVIYNNTNNLTATAVLDGFYDY